MSADFPATGGPPEVRASDADRDRVVDVLRAAVGDGRLTADEFGERMEATLSARTLGVLALLTADLGNPARCATPTSRSALSGQPGVCALGRQEYRPHERGVCAR
jgi:hypothetical protein